MELPKELSTKPFASFFKSRASGPAGTALRGIINSINENSEKNYFLLKKKISLTRQLLKEGRSQESLDRFCNSLQLVLDEQMRLYINYRDSIPHLRKMWSRFTERIVESDETLRNDKDFIIDMESFYDLFLELEKVLKPRFFRSGIIEIYERQLEYLKDKDFKRFNKYVKKERVLLHNLEHHLKGTNIFSIKRKYLTGDRGLNDRATTLKLVGVLVLLPAFVMSVVPYAFEVGDIWHSGNSVHAAANSEMLKLDRTEYFVNQCHDLSHLTYDEIHNAFLGKSSSFLSSSPAIWETGPDGRPIMVQDLQNGSPPPIFMQKPPKNPKKA